MTQSVATSTEIPVRRSVFSRERVVEETKAVYSPEWSRKTETGGFERRALAAHAGTSASDLCLLAADPDVQTRLAVATNPNAPARALALLSKDPELQVREQVWRVARSLDQHADPVAVASDIATDPAELVILAGHESHLIRMRVAANPTTPSGTLMTLCRDPHESVRNWCAVNPNVPTAGLAELADRPGVELVTIVNHPNVDRGMLEALTSSPAWVVAQSAQRRLDELGG